MKAAKAAGAVVSFDLNYRAKLWNISGGHARAVAVLGRIVEHVDVLVGNEEDLQKGLGIPGPEVAANPSSIPAPSSA
jgi:2-dehydro-3-deoxygluconokinase